MEQVTLTRGELFDLVWSTPMNKLARRFGLSDVGLAKTCERFHIPRPPQGHWARVAWNHKSDRPSLPDAPSGVPDVITFGARPLDASGAAADDPRSQAVLVKVAEKLAAPHPTTALLANAIKQTDVDKYGRLLVGFHFHPELCVRRTSLQRALLLLDALFKALTQRGHVVDRKPRGTHSSPVLTVTVATLGDVRIRVEEKLADKPHVPTADEREQEKRWGRKARKYDQVPDGELIFKIDGANWQYSGRKSWSDTKRQRMEHLLGRMISTIEDIANFNHEKALEMQENLRIDEERKRRALRADRLNQWRSWLATDLEGMATNWRTAHVVTEFLDAFEKALSGPHTTPVPAWLAAARSFARRLDPLSSAEKVAKDLDPSDEVLAAFAEEQEKRSAPSRVDGGRRT
jgi:hypothetical protein